MHKNNLQVQSRKINFLRFPDQGSCSSFLCLDFDQIFVALHVCRNGINCGLGVKFH